MIGIFGSGQLGLMLAEAARPLGFECVFLDNNTTGPASLIGKVYPESEFEIFCETLDVASLEFENTPLDLAQKLEDRGVLFPGVKALRVAQDRLIEKRTFKQLDIPTTGFYEIQCSDDLTLAAKEIGLPMVVKTTRGGYDGKGQYVVKTARDIEAAWSELGANSPLIAEAFVDFSREVSLIGVRGRTGEFASYPLVENHHAGGILSHTFAPANNQDQIIGAATAKLKTLMEHLDYVGVLTLELFETADGLLANEIAPRVHNSGHWSIEGAVCSQFENHIRAVTGLPLGSTQITQPSVMINILSKYPDAAQLLKIKGAHLHHYHKSERADRKIGHITLSKCDTPDDYRLLAIKDILPHAPSF